jgi:hypothetical protein
LLVLTCLSLLFIYDQMKKLVFLFLLISLMSSFTYSKAQSGHSKKTNQDLCGYANAKSAHIKKSQQKFGAGVKAGINYASQYINNTSNSVDFKSIIGINAGAYCNYFLLDFLAIQPELMMSGKGSKWINQYYDAKYNLIYLDMPILIKYQPFALFNIHAGPQFSYLISAIQKDFGTNIKTNVAGNFYKFDLGLALGVEANLPHKINVTIRYILGLKTATTGAQYTETWRNRSFQISLGYRILGG